MTAKWNGVTFLVAASATPANPKKLVAVGANVPAKKVAAPALVDIPRKSRLDIFFMTISLALSACLLLILNLY